MRRALDRLLRGERRRKPTPKSLARAERVARLTVAGVAEIYGGISAAASLRNRLAPLQHDCAADVVSTYLRTVAYAALDTAETSVVLSLRDATDPALIELTRESVAGVDGRFEEVLTEFETDAVQMCRAASTILRGLNLYLADHGLDPAELMRTDGAPEVWQLRDAEPLCDPVRVRVALHALTGNETREQIWSSVTDALVQ